MICSDQGCSCAIESSSLEISGSGGAGDPYVIDTNAYSIVTSGTRPGSPFVNQFIYETDTRRIRVWDGTYWVIVGGNYPTFNIQRQSALTIPNNTATTITLPTEVTDTDGFHSGSAGLVTIPAGLGGEYLVTGAAVWAASAVGSRLVHLLVGSNATVQNTPRVGGSAMVSTTDNGFPVTHQLVLEAGATVTLQGLQTSGAGLDISTGTLQGVMIRHLPELV